MPAPTNAAAPAAKPGPTTMTPRSAPPARPAAVPFARLLRTRGPAPATMGARAPGASNAPNVPVAPRAGQPTTHAPHRDRAHPDAHDERDRDLDPLDPANRRIAQLAPPHAPTVTTPSTAARAPEPGGDVAPRARVSLEELLPQLVRRIAWAGDRRRGSVQLEIGAGRHAGTIVTVHADDGRVRVDVQGSEELRARIGDRLVRHGIDVEVVT